MRRLHPREGYNRIATPQVDTAWVEYINKAGTGSIFSRAKSVWFMATNVPGKTLARLLNPSGAGLIETLNILHHHRHPHGRQRRPYGLERAVQQALKTPAQISHLQNV